MNYFESQEENLNIGGENYSATTGEFYTAVDKRFVQTYKKHRNRFKSANEFKDWYNDRIHGALKLDWGETPNEAFIRKLQPESILGLVFKALGW